MDVSIGWDNFPYTLAQEGNLGRNINGSTFYAWDFGRLSIILVPPGPVAGVYGDWRVLFSCLSVANLITYAHRPPLRLRGVILCSVGVARLRHAVTFAFWVWWIMHFGGWVSFYMFGLNKFLGVMDIHGN